MGGLKALSEASNDGVPVPGGRVSELVEDGCGVREIGDRGKSTELEEFDGDGGIELESTIGDKVGLELFDVGERVAFL